MKKRILVISCVTVALFGAVNLKSAPVADLGWRAAHVNGGDDGVGAVLGYAGGEAGAALGTLVCPGIGTLIGGCIGAY